MIQQRVGIIGAGHMGHALVYGLLKHGSVQIKNMIVADPHPEKVKDLEMEFGVDLILKNTDVAALSDIMIITVRPETVRTVIAEIQPFIKPTTLIISAAACVSLELLEAYLGKNEYKVARVMPNLGVTSGSGVIGWYGNKNLTPEDQSLIQHIFYPLGLVLPCQNEDMIDALTVVSGSAPGYFAYFLNILELIAREYGFDALDAKNIVQNTMAGTIKYVQSSYLETSQLVSDVATRGGITEDILRKFDEHDLRSILKTSIQEGYKKIQQVKEELKKEVGH